MIVAEQAWWMPGWAGAQGSSAVGDVVSGSPASIVPTGVVSDIANAEAWTPILTGVTAGGTLTANVTDGNSVTNDRCVVPSTAISGGGGNDILTCTFTPAASSTGWVVNLTYATDSTVALTVNSAGALLGTAPTSAGATVTFPMSNAQIAAFKASPILAIITPTSQASTSFTSRVYEISISTGAGQTLVAGEPVVHWGTDL